jgi:ribonuclease P protein component
MLEVRGAASLLAYPRVAVVVAKHGHGSVARNQLKRRLRELIRVGVLPLLGAVDVVYRAAPAAYEASFDALASDMAELGRVMVDRWPASGTES